MSDTRRSANSRIGARSMPRAKFVFTSSATRSEKLAEDVAASASALTLQGPDVSSLKNLLDNKSLEQLISTAPPAVPHNTINGSSSTYSLSPEKLVAGAAESSSVLTLQQPDVSSMDKFLDSSLEESITARPQLVPHNINGSSSTSPSSCEKLVAGTVESASAPILQSLDVSSSGVFLDCSLEETDSPRTLPHRVGSKGIFLGVPISGWIV